MRSFKNHNGFEFVANMIRCYMSYVFDFDEQLSPSAIEKKQLLFQFSGNGLVARLDQKVSSIVHVHVLLDPVWKIPEKLLQNLNCLYKELHQIEMCK